MPLLRHLAGALLTTALFQGSALSVLPAAVSPVLNPSQQTAAASTGSRAPSKSLADRLAEARAQLAEITGAGPTNVPPGTSTQDVTRRRALLDRLVRIYEQQLGNTAELEVARSRKENLLRESQSWSRFAEPPPYSIHLVDSLREELQATQLKIRACEESTAMLDSLIEENRAELEHAEEGVRRLNERLEGTTDAVQAARLVWQRELERLRSQVTAATLALLDTERLLRQEELAESRAGLGLLQRKLVFAEADAHFSQEDLDQVTGRIERERQDLEQELTNAATHRATAYRTLQTAQQELTRARESSAPAAAALAEAWLATRTAQLETSDAALRNLRLMLEGVSVERTMWELRFAGYDADSVRTLAEAERRLRSFSRRVGLWREQVRQGLEVTSSEARLQATRLSTLAPESPLHLPVREQLETLRERDRNLLRLDRTFERIARLTLRIEDSLRTAETRLPLTDRLQRLFSGAGSFLRRAWAFELFTAEDTIEVDGQRITGKRPVTVGKVVLALLILVGGIWITGWLTRRTEPLFVRHLKIEPNQAVLIRQWLRTLLIACLVFFSLTSVKIPLTVFAFAGGALAIGLGFGMQTLLKNFVSGLILLFERPFRIGDVLDVDGKKGTVTSIGLRASVLQLWDGTETLIPNSSLLEGHVTNWTYSNRRVRFTVGLGVAYGSDARRVMQLLHEVADRHGLVEKDPKAQVLFTEFGDSTLKFELRFWVDVSKANAALVASDLRLMIAGTFEEHGIVIDFPQRDIHLHAARPLPVEVIRATPHGPAPTAASPGPNPPQGPAPSLG